MNKEFKLFVACCAIALAAVSSTAEVKAGPSKKGSKSSSSTVASSSTSTSVPKKGCYGNGSCGITRNGTLLIGKWRE